MHNPSKFPWPSSLSAATVASAHVARRELQSHHKCLYLLERRPQGGANTVLVAIDQGDVSDVLPLEFSVRSRVHEYGGGSYLLGVNALYFVEESSQQIYVRSTDGAIAQLTHQPNSRFGDMCELVSRQALVCVREAHCPDRVVNELVLVSLLDGEVSVLASGDDFYSSPCVSADGREIAFISWIHPNMPWHSNKLWRAQLDGSGLLQNSVLVGAVSASSKSQPFWGAEGELYYLDDCSGWWNLWQQCDGSSDGASVAPIDFDLGRAQWELGAKSFVVSPDGDVTAIASKHGADALLSLKSGSEDWEEVSCRLTQMAWLTLDGCELSVLGASPHSSLGVYRVGPSGAEAVLSPAVLAAPARDLSVAESILFTARDGSAAQGFFYAPCSEQFEYTELKPPLIVVMHGGPTSACSNSYNPLIQYWASRGLAVFDINYRGSTGFGRDYRMALTNSWGVVDVEDCVDGVEALAGMGKVDPNRVAIRGGSAGGFTALAAAVGSDVFAVVGCHYGVADLGLLARDTHKFESRYLDHLIGPYPEQKARYDERSPINHLDKINCPVFISHGELDQVVPVNQAHLMAEALERRGQEVELLLFDDERHGYTKETNMATLLERELEFYVKAFQQEG